MSDQVMLLQTNSYVVPKDKRNEHSRLVQRFRQTLNRLGCDHFEVYEQTGSNWGPIDQAGNVRFVQIMRFRDRRQQQQVQAAERNDPTAQALIREFCELINFPFQQQQGWFAVGFYNSVVTATALPAPTDANVSTAATTEQPHGAEPHTETLSSLSSTPIEDRDDSGATEAPEEVAAEGERQPDHFSQP
jgi:hypothetical protein